MDGLQNQLNSLNNKVEQLQLMVEQLGKQIAAISGDRVVSIAEAENIICSDLEGFPSPPQQPLIPSFMEHKDILSDEGTHYVKPSPNPEDHISADIQIRRLTAQLTAAYNRIAALEEQLLNRHRVNS
ncbi:MAG: hypothetical protein N5P05_001815 [Chroococcopsis gigantea SAG 12.99]|jgi:hypothetical protein|nr:hypothetical protein [Chroococcopsis gigantea SAG 12.99]